VLEIDQVLSATGSKQLPATLKIDELAVLSLDTHRAWESVLKQATTGGSGSTGRGIAPAYADVVYRIPLRMRDLAAKDWQKCCSAHYQLYESLLKGFDVSLAEQTVPRLDGSVISVGSLKQFLARLSEARARLLPYIQSIRSYLLETWQSGTPMVFEKAQAIGLDARWGVYPDVTASDCTFAGISSSTEGVVDVDQIGVRVGVIKATYSSSVGTRQLPTLIKTKLAKRIREDANEYGATTKRPRDIAYIDLPMMSYLFQVGQVNYVVPTHVDISYIDQPIQVCVAYDLNGQPAPYRPDQSYLDLVKPRFVELPPWDGSKLHQAKKISDLPKEALNIWHL
jgi:adenylosuccinate synthase